MKKTILFKVENVVPIVADGAIAHPVMGEGRLIPVLIVDCDRSPALSEAILVGPDFPPGDVGVRWSRNKFDSSEVILCFEFQRPVIANAALIFDVDRQMVLIDGIVNACGVYLQSKESGTRVAAGMAAPKLLVEVPSACNLPDWDRILRKKMVKRMKKEGGLNTVEATQAAEEQIKTMRKLWSMRMRNG